MTTPFFCLILLVILAFSPRPITIAGAIRELGRYDNRNPRGIFDKTSGLGKRAQAAHLNTLEALTVFAPAVFVAHLGGADPKLAAALSVAFIVIRCAYLACYLADAASMRTTVWFLGFGTTLALYLSPLFR